jgi:cytochrome c1
MLDRPAESGDSTPLRKSRRVGLWLVGTFILLLAGAVFGIAYQSWGLMAQQRKEAITRTGGDPDRAPALLVTYGCVNCHNVPGMNAPTGNVGPDLSGVGKRAYIGGVIANSPENLVGWIVDPQSIDPKSAMPKTGITPMEARDVAAYLYAQP